MKEKKNLSLVFSAKLRDNKDEGEKTVGTFGQKNEIPSFFLRRIFSSSHSDISRVIESSLDAGDANLEVPR